MLSDRIRAIAEQLREIATEVEAVESELDRRSRSTVLKPSGRLEIMFMVSAIQRRVCEHFSVPPHRLSSKDRTQHVAVARQVAMYLCREMTDESFPAIGGHFNRDHSTAIHAHNTVARRAAHEPEFGALLQKLTRSLMASTNGANGKEASI
jgi:chromosomal replication initiation ATPase DnaA